MAKIVSIVDSHGLPATLKVSNGQRCLKMKGRPARPQTSRPDCGRAGIANGPSATTRDTPDSQGLDVADATLVEIAGGCVMNGMRTTPVVVRRQRKHAERATGPVVRTTVRKNAPWPQSCWIINRRRRKPAAGTTSTRPHQKP